MRKKMKEAVGSLNQDLLESGLGPPFYGKRAQ